MTRWRFIMDRALDRSDWDYAPEKDRPVFPKGKSVCQCAHEPCICERIQEEERQEREAYE